MRTHCIVVLCLVWSSALTAQERGASSEVPSGFVVEAGEHELTDLIDRAGKFLGRNYLYEQGVPARQMGRGRRGAAPQIAPARSGGPAVEITKRLILDAVACEEVISQFAYARGYLIVPLDALRGLYEVVSLNGSRASSLVSRAPFLTPEEVLRTVRNRRFVRTVLQLEHVATDQVVNQIRPLLSTGRSSVETLQVGAAGNSIVLSGLSESVASAISLLRAIDRAPRAVEPNVQGKLAHLAALKKRQDRELARVRVRVAELEKIVGKMQLAGDKAPAQSAAQSKPKDGKPKTGKGRRPE